MLVAHIVECMQHIEQLKDFDNNMPMHRVSVSQLVLTIVGISIFRIGLAKIKNLKKFLIYLIKHLTRKCPAFGKTSLNCGKVSHFAKVCQLKTFVDDKDESVLFLS